MDSRVYIAVCQALISNTHESDDPSSDAPDHSGVDNLRMMADPLRSDFHGNPAEGGHLRADVVCHLEPRIGHSEIH